MIGRQLAKLLEGTSDAAFAVDPQGDIRIWNRAAEELFGYPSSFAIGRSCAELVRGRDATDKSVCRESCDILECMRRHQDVSNFDLQVTGRSGKRIWVNVSLLSAADERTQRHLTVHFMRDISARKNAEYLAGKMLKIAREIVNGTHDSDSLPPVSPLTMQESRILQLLATGKTTSEITADLRISAPTLRNHLNNVNGKLQTKSRVEAVAEALKRRLI